MGIFLENAKNKLSEAFCIRRNVIVLLLLFCSTNQYLNPKTYKRIGNINTFTKKGIF